MTDLTDAPRPRGRPRKQVFQAAEGTIAEERIESESDWSEMDSAPQDGTFIRLTHDFETETIGRWKPTRRFHSGRWHSDGKWVDELGRSIAFVPEAWAAK